MIGLLTTSGNDDGSIRGGKPVRLLGTPPKKFEKRGPWWPLILAYFTIIEVQIYQPPETSNKDTILCTAAAFKSTLHMMMITYSLIMWHIYNLTVWVSVVLVFKYKCYSFLRILLMWMMEIKGKRFEFRAFCFFNFFTGVRLLITPVMNDGWRSLRGIFMPRDPTDSRISTGQQVHITCTKKLPCTILHRVNLFVSLHLPSIDRENKTLCAGGFWRK